MSVFGQIIQMSLFGESHGEAIGLTINGLPAGIKLDLDLIRKRLDQRRSKTDLTTPRQEADQFEIISGYFKGFTTGTPLTFLIPNTDKRSHDYEQTKHILRPSHADYTGHMRYGGFHDYRGGGHFSGRLTALMVIMGAIAEQILSKKHIIVASHLASIGEILDQPFHTTIINFGLINKLMGCDIPVIDQQQKELMLQLVETLRDNHDSVGGVIETIVLNLPAGYGDPIFDSIESVLAHLMFSVPAVKGVEFGKGFAITNLLGSEANDEFILEKGIIKTKSNHSGGINGGISNGMPILMKTAIKPTSSIAKPQGSVHLQDLTETTLEITGRHDPCIALRAIHVINAMVQYGILETISRKDGTSWMI